ncbi:hypothetical protein [Streptomyces turgidiscabies]|uniref:Uncharacterized protein n=1 Tax=Streptomyces turgidiscabies TaxID=85558 RepID=A0ABU0RSQ6_9ACTN|nr:hypothetical protein [Streptomyces turgidiscabies]MDQ0934818.1 hypothetical protein [Streptomyces turgidiscabies]
MSANAFFTQVKNNFSWVFPIDGHANCLCRKGQKMDLRVKVAGHWVGFPVVVASISKNGWRFDTRFGHPDYPGFISFYFFRKRNGNVYVQLHGNVPFGSVGWFVGKDDYVKRAKKQWAPLITNLKGLVFNLTYNGGV